MRHAVSDSCQRSVTRDRRVDAGSAASAAATAATVGPSSIGRSHDAHHDVVGAERARAR